MKKQTRSILAVAGIISTILGIVGAVPTFLQEKYGSATVFAILIVGGIILIAIAFSD